MEINLDPTSIASAVDGYKTYITLGLGMIVVAANHFGWLPPDYVPAQLDPNNWVNDEYKLVLGFFARSAWKKAEVPSVKAAIVALAIGGAALFAPLGGAFAADLPAVTAKAPPVTAKAPPVPFVTQSCTTALSCSGFYAVGSLAGLGGNADILGQGINGSIFAGGGMIGFGAGAQFWNGSYFFAAELSGDLESQTKAGVTNFAPGGFSGLALVKLGGNAAALFGASGGGTPSPSQGPITIPAELVASLMSPYVQFGDVIRKNGSQWVTGAGAQFFIAPKWTLDVGYLYGAPSDNENALQMVRTDVQYHF
jgi:opacity protein-like surface antigen